MSRCLDRSNHLVLLKPPSLLLLPSSSHSTLSPSSALHPSVNLLPLPDRPSLRIVSLYLQRSTRWRFEFMGVKSKLPQLATRLGRPVFGPLKRMKNVVVGSKLEYRWSYSNRQQVLAISRIYSVFIPSLPSFYLSFCMYLHQSIPLLFASLSLRLYPSLPSSRIRILSCEMIPNFQFIGFHALFQI